jgi:uncharacterized protein (TIGR00255 family)
MTGYASGGWDAPEGRYLIEVKSLNHRYMEVRVKLPVRYDFWEYAIITLIRQRFSRGRFDVVISEVSGGVKTGMPRVDKELAASYAHILKEIKDEFSLSGDVTVDTLARMKDVIYFTDEKGDADALWDEFSRSLDGVLDALKDMRAREGTYLKKDLVMRVEKIGRYLSRIEEIFPDTITAHRERLSRRIGELVEHEMDPARLEQEVVVFAERSDITEEIVRLKSHIEGFVATLEAGSPLGKKLDFYLQEMWREINTIGSKGAHAEISSLVVEAKTELEKLREQVQNVE